MSEEQIDQDELNMHECMLPLMKLFDHMEHNKITPQVPQVYIVSTNRDAVGVCEISIYVVFVYRGVCPMSFHLG